MRKQYEAQCSGDEAAAAGDVVEQRLLLVRARSASMLA